MMTFLIYLYGFIGSLNGAISFAMAISMIVLFSVIIILFVNISNDGPDKNEEHRRWVKVSKNVSIIIAILTVFVVILPSQNTYAAMVILPKIAQNKSVQELPGNAAKAMNEGLKKWIVNLSPDNKK